LLCNRATIEHALALVCIIAFTPPLSTHLPSHAFLQLHERSARPRGQSVGSIGDYFSRRHSANDVTAFTWWCSRRRHDELIRGSPTLITTCGCNMAYLMYIYELEEFFLSFLYFVSFFLFCLMYMSFFSFFFSILFARNDSNEA
jgi:hypothetical protein